MLLPRSGLWALLLSFLLSSFVPTLADSAAEDPVLTTRATSTVVQSVLPSLVNLEVVRREFVGGRECKTRVSGSGVIVSSQGHVLTNFHVARQAMRITAKNYQGEEYSVEVIAEDALTDLALLKLESGRSYPIIPFADSEQIEVGETVLALGNPLALSSSVSKGVVSNAKRVFVDRSGTELMSQEMDSKGPTGFLTRWIQHDALICPGNSGGPLVDIEGRLVGINQLGGQGLGFAIPSNVAYDFYQRVVSGQPLQRGWLGFTVQPTIKEMKRGALISSIFPGSAAHDVGLKSGDVLLRLNQREVTVNQLEEIPEFYEEITKLKVGDKVPLTYSRDGNERQAILKVEDLALWLEEERCLPDLGATVQTLTPSHAFLKEIDTRRGVLLNSVRAGYPLDKAQPALKPGDVILALNGQSIESVDALLKAPKSSTLRFEVWRHGSRIVSLVKPEEPSELGLAFELPRACLGIRAQPLTTALAEELGTPSEYGLNVNFVRVQSAAEKAGIHKGDIITQIDGVNLRCSPAVSRSIFKETMDMHQPGDVIGLELLRQDGSREVLQVALGTAPSTGQDSILWLEQVGICVVVYHPQNEFVTSETGGLMIANVDPGGWGNLAGLKAGDIVQAVDSRPVHEPAQLRDELGSPSLSKKRLISVKRKQQVLNIILEVF
jgi:serine protease Do